MTRSSSDAILELPAAERVAVVEERRWQAIERDPDAGESWEAVKRELERE